MIPERVPGQIRENPVVLVPVIPIMSENNIRTKLSFDLFKPIFYRRPFAGKIAFTKGSDSDLPICYLGKKIGSAFLRLRSSISRRAEDDPPNFQIGSLRYQFKQSAA